MSVEEELAAVSLNSDTMLTVGVFDGVHLGHKYLISQLIKQAGQQNLLPGVITFRQHPEELLSPRTRLPFLTDLTERSNLLKKEGVGAVIPLSFTTELARQTFIESEVTSTSGKSEANSPTRKGKEQHD